MSRREEQILYRRGVALVAILVFMAALQNILSMMGV